MALGFCAVFGTLAPPLYSGELRHLFSTVSGLVTLSGIPLFVFGICLCSYGGVRKERELSSADRRKAVKEYNLKKGLLVGAFAGIMSGCFAIGIAAGKPLADMALQHGAPSLWQNSPIFVVLLAGGFTTNFFWCVTLNIKNRSGGNYASAPEKSLLRNYLFSGLAGLTGYGQFLFYGMGTTFMGEYDFSSWTIHMAFIIIFGNLWGFAFREWRGVGTTTLRVVNGFVQRNPVRFSVPRYFPNSWITRPSFGFTTNSPNRKNGVMNSIATASRMPGTYP